MRGVDWLFGAVIAGIGVLASGCSGLEVGGKAWISRVDERYESQKTHREAVPWKCYFVSCPQPTSAVEGS